MNIKLKLSVAIIIRNDKKMLLVRKKGTDYFIQPGGKIDLGETPVDALKRELLEELGLEIPEFSVSHCGAGEAQAANEKETSVTAEIFYLETNFDPIAQAEIEELVWVDSMEEDVCMAPLTTEVIFPIYKTLI